jgi:hypothetical protein
MVAVLSGMEYIKLLSAYHRDGKLLTELPLGPADLSPHEPFDDELAGRNENVGDVRK